MELRRITFDDTDSSASCSKRGKPTPGELPGRLPAGDRDRSTSAIRRRRRPAACSCTNGIVHQEEGLERHGRSGADVGRGVRVGPVEEGQVRMLDQPLGHQVDAPAIGRVDRLEGIVLRPAPAARSAGTGAPGPRRSSRPDDREHRVADRLGVEPPAAGIARASDRRGRQRGHDRRPARELVGPRQQDLPVQRLDRPAARRRAGRRASRAARDGSARLPGGRSSRAWRRSPAEVVLPDPVDHHPGRQRDGRAA